MAAITPKNGRAAFVSAWDPHTYWELNSTNLGTNYGDDTSGNDDNSNVASGDISTQDSYDGMNAQNDPPTNGWMDIYLINDACALVYIPAGLAHGTNYGLFHNGGGTNGQGGFLRATTTGVEIACNHCNGGDSPQDCLIEEIPDAELPGWFCLGFQFNSEGGAEGDMGLWINGILVRSATRTYTLDYGSGNPDFGNNGAREPNAATVRDPSSYGGGDWGNNTAINSSGILIANFTCDNPSGGASDTSAGNGDAFHTDYYDEHVDAGGEHALLADDVESASEASSPAIGQEHVLLADNVESDSEVTSPTVRQEHTLLADSVEGASEVTAPALTESHVLLADNIESASETSAPVVGQEHGLLVSSVESASEITAPAVGQEHAILADSVESAPEITVPVLAEVAPIVDVLLADNVESGSEGTSPEVGQIHALLSGSVESASELSQPVLVDLGALDVLLANDVESASRVSAPTLTETPAPDMISYISGGGSVLFVQEDKPKDDRLRLENETALLLLILR